MMIPLGINGCDQDNNKVEELIKLMLRFNGVLPGTILKDKNYCYERSTVLPSSSVLTTMLVVGPSPTLVDALRLQE